MICLENIDNTNSAKNRIFIIIKIENFNVTYILVSNLTKS